MNNSDFVTKMDEWAKQEKDRKQKAADIINKICEKAFPKLVRTIVARYSGEGDSGNIDEIMFRDGNDNPVEFTLSNKEDFDFQWACFEYLPSGFEINEGGSGEVFIDTLTRKVEVQHKAYFTEMRAETYHHYLL